MFSKRNVMTVACAVAGLCALSSVAWADKIVCEARVLDDNLGTQLDACGFVEIGVLVGATPDIDPIAQQWQGVEFYWSQGNGPLHSFDCADLNDALHPDESECPSFCDGPGHEQFAASGATCPGDEAPDPSTDAIGKSFQIPTPHGVCGNVKLWAQATAYPDCLGQPDPDSQSHDSLPPERIDNQAGDTTIWSLVFAPTQKDPIGGDFDDDCWGDKCDECPQDPNKGESEGICGCGVSDVDTDGDCVADCVDQCDNNPHRVCQGQCNCDYEGPNIQDLLFFFTKEMNGVTVCDAFCHAKPIAPGAEPPGDGNPCIDEYTPIDLICFLLATEYDFDSDGDGSPDCQDLCPLNPKKQSPGLCGCKSSDADTDGDGTPDCLCPELGAGNPDNIHSFCTTDAGCDGAAGVCKNGKCVIEDVCGDQCKFDPNKLYPGVCGCGTPDIDTDGDGALNCVETCDNDPNKTAPGQCGCSHPDTDSDGDGTANCADVCLQDPNKTTPGDCGCGLPETKYFIGGSVYANQNDPFFTGLGNVLIRLKCNFETFETTTNCPGGAEVAGLWSIDGACGQCFLTAEFLPEDEDCFEEFFWCVANNGVTCENTPFTQKKITVNQNYPSLQIKGSNGYLDVNDDGMVSIAGDTIPFANCVFGNACPTGACRSDCNRDGSVSIIPDVQCFADCVFGGLCDVPCDLPAPSFDGYTVGGSVHLDGTDPILSGVGGMDVKVQGKTTKTATTNEWGLWFVEDLPAGSYRVSFDGGKATMVITVSDETDLSNRSLIWDLNSGNAPTSARPIERERETSRR